MKIRNQACSLDTAKISLPRAGAIPPLQITITALPFGTFEKLDRLFPRATAPMRFVNGANGLPLRDPETKKVVTEIDISNADYVRETNLCNARRRAYQLWLILAPGGDVAFETNIDWTGAAVSSADGIVAELETSGLGAGDVVTIIEAAMKLSNFGEDVLAEATADFFRGKGAKAD